MSDIAIKVENLSKLYRIGSRQNGYRTLRESIVNAVSSPFRRLSSVIGLGSSISASASSVPGPRPSVVSSETIWALKDVSFEVKHGEIVGIIGRNGAGKSTLLKILSRITEPTEGNAEIHGRAGSLLEVGTGFHPELTGRENIYLNGAILGMKKSEIEQKFDQIVAFAEIDRFIDTPVKYYSSGMYVRLAFAVAAHLEPEILLVDEVLAVGDAAFQNKCLGKMGDVAKEGRTVLFVSHNMATVRRLCKRGIWLETGKVKLIGTAGECIDMYIGSVEDFPGSELGFFDLATRSDRSGNGKVRFRTIRLVGSDGTERNHFDFYEPFTIEFCVECRERVKPFFVGFTLLTIEGTSIFSSHHSDSAGLRSLNPGHYSLSCFVNPNPLKPGSYLLQLGIGDFTTWECYDWFYAMAKLTIQGGSGKFDSHLDGRPGYIHPLLSWRWLN
jgi:lipopolysaccharide transport system ATP-binding protein